MSNMAGSLTGGSSGSYRRAAGNTELTHPTTMNVDGPGATTNEMIASASSAVSGDIKPRSLRFTWSMKTTSSMDPADMMKEIRKVKSSRSFFVHIRLYFQGPRNEQL